MCLQLPTHAAEAEPLPVEKPAAPNPPKRDPVKLFPGDKKLKEADDQGQKQREDITKKVRLALENRRFDELEADAKEMREKKENFVDGGPKSFQFYYTFGTGGESEEVWQQHDKLHQEWIAAKPDSITARIAHAAFLNVYAWRARGSGYANTVGEENFRIFRERLEKSAQILEAARKLPEKDRHWWHQLMTVALGQSWPKPLFEKLIAEAHAFDHAFYMIDDSRVYSLLPRWLGEPGEWEAYAEAAAARPDGLGAESYARMVNSVSIYYDNVFRETKANWPKTREGLEIIRQKFPFSLYWINASAKLATQGEDWPLAMEMFRRIGNNALNPVWYGNKNFIRHRKMAEAGKWEAPKEEVR